MQLKILIEFWYWVRVRSFILQWWTVFFTRFNVKNYCKKIFSKFYHNSKCENVHLPTIYNISYVYNWYCNQNISFAFGKNRMELNVDFHVYQNLKNNIDVKLIQIKSIRSSIWIFNYITNVTILILYNSYWRFQFIKSIQCT